MPDFRVLNFVKHLPSTSCLCKTKIIRTLIINTVTKFQDVPQHCNHSLHTCKHSYIPICIYITITNRLQNTSHPTMGFIHISATMGSAHFSHQWAPCMHFPVPQWALCIILATSGLHACSSLSPQWAPCMFQPPVASMHVPAPSGLYACSSPQWPQCMFQPPVGSMHVPATSGLHACSSPQWAPCMFQPPVASMHVPAPSGLYACSSPQWPQCMFQPPVGSMHVPAISGLHACSSSQWAPCMFQP